MTKVNTITAQKITPNLWFDDQAEEAANFYTSVFDNSGIGRTSHYGEAGTEIHGQKAGTVMTIEFHIDGFTFTALNGGPHFTPSPSISFFVNCETEDEVNRLWEKLSEAGTVMMPLDKYPFSPKYGWVQDKYGVSWQIILSEGEIPQKIMPSLMFVKDVCGKAEEAINFYTSVFSQRDEASKDSEIGEIFRYGADQQPDEEGTIAYADFKLDGQFFTAMDSAQDHKFDFSEGVSLIVNCETQDEIDYFWEKLSAVPEAEACGWLKDKYGVSWQIVPTVLQELDGNSDAVMSAILQMKKINIEGLKQAAES